jgi:hypothetical protein
MSRWWTEAVAGVSDVIALPLLTLLLIGTAAAVGALWYWFPAWVPTRLPRLRIRIGRPRLRRPAWRWPGWPDWLRLSYWRDRLRRRKRTGKPATAATPAEVPDVDTTPATAVLALADRLAAEGRYAEAIRERLRAVARRLTERGIVNPRPGWTVTELTSAAGTVLPAVHEPLDQAGRVFSEVWYAQRPADADTDGRMRALASSIDRVLGGGPT